MKKKLLLALLLAGSGLGSGAQAANGMAIEAGNGDSTNMAQLSLVRQWDKSWFTEGNWYLTGYWEASVGRWHNSDTGGKDIWDVGLTPVFRLCSKGGSRLRPYFEGAIGAHLIDHTHVNGRRDLGSAFQFGDHLGAGITFGDHRKFDLGYRFQHVSNADLKRPNDGINFQQIRFAYLF
jgi:lipid A 3-O-deacylase